VERDFPPDQTGSGAHPVSYAIGTGSFPGVKYGRGMLLTTHPLLVPRSWKSRDILLPTLWATTGPGMGTLYLCINSDITPFAMCTTEIEAATVLINVGSEILCDKVYFILSQEKQCYSGSANFTSAFRLDVSNRFDISCDGT